MTNQRLLGILIVIASLCGCAGPNSALNQDGPPSANKDNPACTATGSRLASSANCASFGRSYSRDDIDRTGSPTAAGALGLLDPSVTIH